MTSHQFDHYILYHENDPSSRVKATVHCFYGDASVGYIRFYSGEVPGPEVLSGGLLEIAFGAERIHEIIMTLRYEKPLFISAQGKKSVLSTVREPVGEQEA
jgi:hypothetical protein